METVFQRHRFKLFEIHQNDKRTDFCLNLMKVAKIIFADLLGGVLCCNEGVCILSMTSFGFFTMIEAKNTEQKGSNIKCGHFSCLAGISNMESESQHMSPMKSFHDVS